MERVSNMTRKEFKAIKKELEEHREERIKKYQEWCIKTQPTNKRYRPPKGYSFP